MGSWESADLRVKVAMLILVGVPPQILELKVSNGKCFPFSLPLNFDSYSQFPPTSYLFFLLFFFCWIFCEFAPFRTSVGWMSGHIISRNMSFASSSSSSQWLPMDAEVAREITASYLETSWLVSTPCEGT